jgi:hypothetical protein
LLPVGRGVRSIAKILDGYSSLTTALATAFIALLTLSLAWSAYQQSQQLQAQSKPYVSLGRPDGTPMTLQGASDNKRRTTVAMYFHNAGQGAALRFWVNAWSVPPSLWKVPQANYPTPDHLQRWRNLRTGDTTGYPSGPNLAAGATTTVWLSDLYTISSSDIPAIENGEKELRIQGTYEYCDEFGDYYCSWFNAVYQTAPVGAFVVDQPTNDCSTRQPLPDGSPTEVETNGGSYITFGNRFKFPGVGALQNGMTVMPTKFKLLTPCSKHQEQKNPYNEKVPEN